MTGFTVVSLCLLAVFAAGSMLTPFLIAAKNRTPALAFLAFIIAAWAVTVLAYAAWRL